MTEEYRSRYLLSFEALTFFLINIIDNDIKAEKYAELARDPREIDRCFHQSFPGIRAWKRATLEADFSKSRFAERMLRPTRSRVILVREK